MGQRRDRGLEGGSLAKDNKSKLMGKEVAMADL
jgi:hypothetical protein